MNPLPKSSSIQGGPLDIAELLDIAEIDNEDIENAIDWWDEHASPEWVGALDSEPIDDGV